MRRVMHIALALVMSLTMTIPAAAAEVGTAGSGGEVPVTISADATAFSVTVPTSIPLYITTDATVTCANNLSIQNRSAGPVEVSGILVQDSAWSIISFNGGDRSLLASEKVNSNKLGIAFTPDGGTQTESSDGGTQNITVNSAEWVVSADGSLSFDCDAIATAVSSTISDAIQAANVVFTVKWKVGSTSGSGGSSESGGSGSSGSSEPDAPEGVLTGNFISFSSPSTFSIGTANSTKQWDGTLEYSTNAMSWDTWNGDSKISAEDNGTVYTLYIRGKNNETITDVKNYAGWSLTSTDKVRCDGNIENILDYDTVASGNHPTMGDNCFAYLFEDWENLTKGPSLSATQLAPYCYYGMFEYCIGLTSVPTLPSVKMEEHCYEYMFRGCTSLTSVPNELLPAMELADYCYSSMFTSCANLTAAPKLPAKTLAEGCYSGMFSDDYGHGDTCSSLTSIPENLLPATELKPYCYDYMFAGSGLTTIPENLLPAKTLADYCYFYMFYYCENIITIPEKLLPATNLATYCYSNMFAGTSITTVPKKLLSAVEMAEGCYDEMFKNCSNLTTVPALPATSLAPSCYASMFWDCDNLITIPELPATELPEYCYTCMFRDCEKIKVSTSPEDGYSVQYTIPTGRAAVTASQTALDSMFIYAGGPFKGTPNVNTTYYLSDIITIIPTT